MIGALQSSEQNVASEALRQEQKWGLKAMIPKYPSEHRALELVAMIAANEEAFAPQSQREQTGIGSERARAVGWDPFEVWRTRVKAVRESRSTSEVR